MVNFSSHFCNSSYIIHQPKEGENFSNAYPDPQLDRLLFRLLETRRKIALVRASRICDFVCATLTFRAIRKALPLADISLIAQNSLFV